MKSNEYKCEVCLNIYEKAWTDKEMEEEVKEIWGIIPQEDRAIICDDCFNRRSRSEIKAMGDEYKKLSTPYPLQVLAPVHTPCYIKYIRARL